MMSQGIESNSTNAVASPSMLEEEVQVNSVSEFIEKIVQLDKKEGTEIFYRGRMLIGIGSYFHPSLGHRMG